MYQSLHQTLIHHYQLIMCLKMLFRYHERPRVALWFVKSGQQELLQVLLHLVIRKLECIMPDIDSAIENFKNAMLSLDAPPVAVTATSVASIVTTPTAPIEEIECPNCNTKLGANAKFCPECGNKIEIKKPAFCTQCGEHVTASSKFCANCGAKMACLFG